MPKKLGHLQELTVRPVTLEIKNEAIHGKTIKEIRPLVNRNFVISRIRHHDGQQEVELVNSETILHIDDKILVISNLLTLKRLQYFWQTGRNGMGTVKQETYLTPHFDNKA